MTSFAEKVIQYFKEQIKEDVALAKVFDESKIDECEKYVRNQAQKQAVKGCAVIEDAVVYKWSRDFYYGDTAPTTEKKEQTVEVKKATVITQKKNKKNPKKEQKEEDGFDKYDMCLFADISEEDLWGK